MYERGSEWRRWDLHIHTPETALNDRFGDWDEYLSVIEASPEIKVLGITDYYSITNYSKLKQFKSEGRLEHVELLIPNIEFRIAPPSNKATAINIHILVNPDEPQHEQEIVNSLGRLSWEYDGRRYSCLPEQLIALGYAFNPEIQDDRSALRVGVMQFKVDFSTLRDWYSSEQWLYQNSITVVAAGDDGLSGFQQDSAWGGYRQEITRFSQMIFSGRPGERDFWLGLRSPDDHETIERLGGLKPCIHGSDAHEVGKLFYPDHDRYCWIKADTTFEGLKQLCYEPANRVYIGPTPPKFHDQARVISSVRLTNTNDWFDDAELPLNAGLVSIIGQKGSGKSALAELIAYASGSWANNEPSSFLERAGIHLKDLQIKLCWADGAISNVTLGDEQPNNEDVRYLSQKFVERLCADDHIGADLVREIESVVFSYLDPTDTLNASDFVELRAIRTAGIREEADRLQQEVVQLIREECALRNDVAKLPDKNAKIKTLTSEREGLVKQIPKPTSKNEKELQQTLQAYRTALTTLGQTAAAEKQKLQKIKDIRIRVNAFSIQMGRFSNEIDELLRQVGTPEHELVLFHPTLSTNIEQSLTDRETEIKQKIETLFGNKESPAKETIEWFRREIAELEKQESADKALHTRIKTAQTRIAAIDIETQRIQTEIQQIEGPAKERIKAARQEMQEKYTAYFKNLKHEQETLEDLYKPVSAHLAGESASKQEQDLEFSIKWEVSLDDWLARGSRLFDQRKTIPYGTLEELAAAARRILVPAWGSGEPESIGPAMEEFLSEFRKPEYPPSKYLRTGVTVQDVLQWFYEVKHIQLSYGLKYNGIELEKLSPGTKGIVLLILYLGMDVSDTRPLIVDQPDENLDNESIYELLTAYFKVAKERRQIILITHNPNLVVNTDSEQVIVASAVRRENSLPTITYQSGALENNVPEEHSIRQSVCRILEGGSDAFRKRERRYALE